MRSGEVDNGCITLEKQAAFLAKYAHLEGIVGNDSYYTYAETGKGFRVTKLNGQVVQVSKMTADEAKTMVACSKLKFGD
jgi:hypothetical protein